MPAVPLEHHAHATHLDLGLKTARDLLDRRTPDDALPITLDPLRRLLPHGLLRGELIELHGDRSCGRLSMVLALLAAATASGETAALVDLGDHFDPQDAEAAGVVLERLLWLRPARHEADAPRRRDRHHRRIPAGVCDLGAPPIRGGRGAQTSWLRLLAAARVAPSDAPGLDSVPRQRLGGHHRARGAPRPRDLARRAPARSGCSRASGTRVTLKKMRGGTPEIDGRSADAPR